MRHLRLGTFWLLVGLVLVVAASRVIRIHSFSLDNDEIWSIWQTFGTPEQIVQWTSPTEHPLYFLMLGLWKDAAGFDPFVLRYLSLLVSLPGFVFMYRAVRRGHGTAGGVVAALAYYAIAVNIFTSLMTRSYVVALTVLPLFLWMGMRYLERPTIRRAVVWAATAFVVYTATITVVMAAGLVGLYLVARYGWRVWRGWLPAVMTAVFVLPDFINNKVLQVQHHSGAERMNELPPLPEAIFSFFSFFTTIPIVWYGLVVTGGAAIVYAYWRRRDGQRGVRAEWFWAVWVIGVPILLYVLEPMLGFFTPRRYGWWYVFGVALFLGVSLRYLPRAGYWAAGVILIGIMFVPFRLNNYSYIVTPLGENLRWLREHWQGGDRLLIDPALDCSYPEEWDYYRRVYFPTGLGVVDEAAGVRRVWYAASLNEASQAVTEALTQGRMPGRFVGPPGCFFRLYEGPPDTSGVLFENGMRFHGAEIMNGDKPVETPTAYREGETLRIRMWWSVDAPVPLDYSVGVYLNGAEPLAQSDSAPQVIYPAEAAVETSRWTPGQMYVEERVMQIPYPYGRSNVTLSMAVYWYGDQKRFGAPGVVEDNLLVLMTLPVVAW